MKVDFSGVDKEIRGRSKTKHIPEGDYLAKIVDCENRKSESKGTRYLNWKFQIVEGPQKGTTVYGITSLKAEALWNLRNLIFAATGKNVAGKSVNFDPENVIGKIVGIAVEDNEYTKDGNTKVSSRVNTAFPKEEYESGDDEDEDEDDDSDEEEEEDEDEDDDDDDLEDVEVDDI